VYTTTQHLCDVAFSAHTVPLGLRVPTSEYVFCIGLCRVCRRVGCGERGRRGGSAAPPAGRRRATHLQHHASSGQVQRTATTWEGMSFFFEEETEKRRDGLE